MNELHAAISKQQTAHPEAAFIVGVILNTPTSRQCSPNSTSMFPATLEETKLWIMFTQTLMELTPSPTWDSLITFLCF